MDYIILNCYRITWSEILLLYDTIIIYNKRRKINKTIKEFTQGIHLLIKTDRNNLFLDEDESLDLSEDTVLKKLLWQFTHGVIFEFLAEELSQYPFWAAKVVSVVNKEFRSNLNVLESAFTFFQRAFSRGGIRAIFEANVPYLAASVIMNYDYFQKMTKGFFHLYETQLPQRSSSGTLANSKLTNGKPQLKRRRSVEGVTKKPKPIDSSYWSFSSIISRLTVATLVHPLLTLSVRMLTDPTLLSQNWLSAYWTLIRTKGIPVLYTGLRISLLLGLFPIQQTIYSLGIPETVLYRRMSGEGQSDGLGGSYSVLYSALVDEGTLGLVGYGILSAAQIVPGFVTFVASKWIVWLLCGTSRQREKQFRRRKAILESVWPKKSD